MKKLLRAFGLMLGIASPVLAGPTGPPAGKFILDISTGANIPTFKVSSGTVNGPLVTGSLTCTGSPCGSAGVSLTSTQTWSGQNNWLTPAPSTFTYGVVVGSETVSGPGNGNIVFTISGSTYGVISDSISPPTVGQCAVFSSTNGTVSGTTCGGGGTPASPNNSIQFNNAGAFGGNADFEHFASSIVYTNQFVDTGIQTSSFTYGVQASSLTLKTIGGFGGELDFWNSGANNDTIKFFNDSGAAQAFINENVGTWWRIDVDGGAAFIVQTADTNRLAIDAAGTVAVESGGLQLWSRTKAQIAVITPDSINSQVTGEEYYCSDCATVAVCISTGSAQGAFALITNKASACQ